MTDETTKPTASEQDKGPAYPRYWSLDDDQGVPQGVFREAAPFRFEVYMGNGLWESEPEASRWTREDARPMPWQEAAKALRTVDQRRKQAPPAQPPQQPQ